MKYLPLILVLFSCAKTPTKPIESTYKHVDNIYILNYAGIDYDTSIVLLNHKPTKFYNIEINKGDTLTFYITGLKAETGANFSVWRNDNDCPPPQCITYYYLQWKVLSRLDYNDDPSPTDTSGFAQGKTKYTFRYYLKGFFTPQ